MATKYKITIQRSLTEEYELELEAEHAMAAFDEARKMVASRPETSFSGKFSVIKVEEKEIDHGK